jgi:plastocyanin
MKESIASQKRLFVTMLPLLTIFSITNSCKKVTDTPGANEVFIQGMAFNPSTIKVCTGTTITWTNKDGIA